MVRENQFNLLGFNAYSSNIINVLMSGETFTVKQVYEKTHIPKNKIYETLDFLISKGIVGEEKGKPKKYFVINVGILDSMIQKKEDELVALKENLEEMKKKREKINPSVLSIIEGNDELHRLIEYSNQSIKKEILSCSRLTKMYYGCYRSLKEAVNRGVTVKFIGVYTGKNFDVLKSYHDIGVEIRIFDSKKEAFPKIGLFDEQYARITIWDPKTRDKKKYKTIWANSPLLYKIVKNHFNTIWEQSIPFDPNDKK